MKTLAFFIIILPIVIALSLIYIAVMLVKAFSTGIMEIILAILKGVLNLTLGEEGKTPEKQRDNIIEKLRRQQAKRNEK